MKFIFSLSFVLFVFSVSGIAQNAQKAVDAYNRGLELQDSGDTANALAAYDLALRLNPKMLDAYNNRANLKLASGDQNGAIEDFTKVIELTSGHALSYYNRGNIYLELQRYDPAIADFTKAIEILNGLTNNYDKKAHGM